MSKLRWINLLVALVLVVALAIAARPTFAAPLAMPSAGDLASPNAVPAPAPLAADQCLLSAADLQSLHVVEMPDESVRILETANGPLGFEGGYAALIRCR